jgi:glycine oxidase
MKDDGNVLVIGGGIVGLSIAHRLAKMGAEVTLYDACRTGRGASSAATGLLSPGGEFTEPSEWLAPGLASLNLYPDFVDTLQSDTTAHES